MCDTTILGSHAITYVVTMYFVFKIRKIMLNFEVIGQMVLMRNLLTQSLYQSIC